MDLYHKSTVVSQKTLNPNEVTCVVECDPFLNSLGLCTGPCFEACPAVCKTLIVPDLLPPLFPLPPPQPPPPPSQPLVDPPPHVNVAKNNHLSVTTISLTIIASIMGAALLFGVLFAILRCYVRRRNSRSSRSEESVIIEDFDQGQQIDNPIWYINTIGLQRSVIESILMFKYKKGEGLIEGTECSVCLSGFQEDESLRLLPKCSHAFHVDCIDTWLRSHKTCPLCRAPIVRDSFDGQVGVVVSSMIDSSSRDESATADSANSSGLMGNLAVNDVGSEETNRNTGTFTHIIEQEVDGGYSDTTTDDSLMCNQSFVKSESSECRELELQPIRRSMSLDSSSALSICETVANGLPQFTNWKLKNVVKRGSTGSSSFNKMRTYAILRSLQKGPVSMKRSLSSGWRASTSRRCRSLESILTD